MRRCLDSLHWVDEIVVIDSHSTDGTTEICLEYTEKVFHYPFQGFGALRNQAISHAVHDWIFSLDTDEWATSEVQQEIENLLAQGPPMRRPILCLAGIISLVAGSSIVGGIPTIVNRNYFIRAICGIETI